MSKSVVIILGSGNLDNGFPRATAQLWAAGHPFPEQFIGSLPPAPALVELYRSWQSIYQNLCDRKQLLARSLEEDDDELEIDSGGITNVSIVSFDELSQQLTLGINTWLKSEELLNIERQLRTHLDPGEEIRVIIETNDDLLRRLPWHRWDFFTDYPLAEMALSRPEYKRARPSQPKVNRKKVRILAILGNSRGITLETETSFLKSLQDAETNFLIGPTRAEFNEQLWDSQGWDILFFAGHSQTEGETGRIYLNENQTNNSLTIEQLEEALKQAIENGLRLAIFNSCDGLGLSLALERLNIPQVIVMREPVPNLVAQEFFKHFLEAFAVERMPLYMAAQQARRKLQGLEDDFPGASWLPVICQNPAVKSPTWLQLGGILPCPYRGLFAFREEDAHLFFGRDKFVQDLVATMKKQPLVAVVGPSGSGKSSVVFAGLIPTLRAEVHGNTPLYIVSFRPGNNPIKELAAALVDSEAYAHRPIGIGEVLSSRRYPGNHDQGDQTIFNAKLQSNVVNGKDLEDEGDTEENVLGADATSYKSHIGEGDRDPSHPQSDTRRLVELELANALRQDNAALSKIIASFVQASATRLILIADQFEELYTLCPESERQPFLDALLTASRCSPAFTLVITLRADFYGHALSYRPFSDALQGAIQNLGPMSHEELQSAIEEPAAQMQVKLEDGLTNKLINDVGGHPGRLPLLEFALTTLWSKQKDGLLTNQAYEEIGGVEAALANHAEAVYSQLSEADRHRTQQVFMQLVQPGAGTDANRRLATRDEVKEENWDLVTRLASSRLVITNRSESTEEETVEIVHEALIRSWGHIECWMQLDGEFRRWQEQLRAAVRQWESSSKDEGALLRGKPLADAEYWQHRRQDELSSGERNFIELSIQLRDREIKTQEIKALSESSEGLFASDQKLDALISALKAGKKLKEAIGVEASTQIRVVNALQQAVYWVRERNRLQGHQAAVNSVSFSPDGQMLASGSDDSTIKLWSLQGKELRTLQGHEAALKSIRFSLDGKRLVSGSADGTIKLWAMEDGKEIRTFKGHSGQVNEISLSPDGKTIASASRDKTIKLWSVEGKKLKTLKHSAAVLSVAWSPDGQMFASASADGVIKLWNKEGQELWTITGHSDEVNSISFSPNGEMLASAGYDKTLRLWRIVDGQKIWMRKGHSDSVRSVNFSPDGKTIASASIDKTIKLWRMVDGEELGTIKNSSWIVSLAWSPDNKTLAFGSLDQTIKLWSLEGKELRTLTGHRDVVRSASFSPDGKTIASASDDKTIKLWKMVDGNELMTFIGHSGKVYSVAWSPDGKTIASASEDKTIKLWRMVDGQELMTLKHRGAVRCVSFSPDGKTIASASDDKTIKLWRMVGGKVLMMLAGHSDAIYSLAWSPDGKMLASGSEDKTIKLWRMVDGNELMTLNGHGNSVRSVAWSPDSQTIASASTDNTIKLWNLDGKELTTLNGEGGWVYSVAWSPDGKIIASAGDDNTVRLWSLNGKELRTLKGHSHVVRCVAWSPDSKQLVSASNDTTVFLWNLELLDLDVLLRCGCDWVHDYLETNPNVSEGDRTLFNTNWSS